MVAMLVVLTIALFVAADLVVQWVRAGRLEAVRAAQGHAAPGLLIPDLQPERFRLPGGLFFYRGHTWGNVLFSGQVKIGLDDFLQKLFGKIDAVTLPPAGAEVKQGQPFAAIRQGGRTAFLTAPLDGIVCAVNSEVAKLPEIIKRDPYTRGWLIALRPTNLAANLSALAVGEGALGWLRSETLRFQEFLHGTLTRTADTALGTTAADGGMIADGILEHLDNETWTAFQSKFLSI